MIRTNLLYFILNHAETESASEARSIRVEAYVTTASLHYLFYDCQAQAYAFIILMRCPIQLTKACEQFWEILFCDARPCVNHVDYEQAFLAVVASLNLNVPFLGEFKRVFD